MHFSGAVIISLLLPYGVLAIALREPLVDMDVIIGDTATLQGTVTDNPSKLDISWRRQDTQEVLTLGEFLFSTQLYVRARYDIQVSGETYNLVISSVESGDEGVFEFGYVSNGKFVPLSSLTLSVFIPPDAGFPVCDASPVETEYLVGQSLTLSCQSKGGKPEPDIVWLRNGIELERTSLSNTLDHVLTLEPSDTGVVFECRLVGPAVVETLSCQEILTVATPTVSLDSSVVVVDEGSDAVFNCVGQGVLSPTYAWSFPTDILQNSRYIIENADRRLTILNTTMADNNVVVRCELTSSGKVVAGRSATLLIQQGPTTKQPTVSYTTVAATTNVRTTVAPTTTRRTTIHPTTTLQTTALATTKLQPTTPVEITTTQSITTNLLRKTTGNTPIKLQTTSRKIPTALPKTSQISTSSILQEIETTQYMTVPQDIFITTLPIEIIGKTEPTTVPVQTKREPVPKQESDTGRNSQRLGLIFATATATLIVLTIVISAAFCLVVCKPRKKKDSFNVSNNASSLAGSATVPPYDNGVFRRQSEYHSDYELTDSVSQRESQASATESAAAVSTTTTYPEGIYTMPVKFGRPSTKLYHQASSSHPDFSTFRLVDESLRNNKSLSVNSLGKRPRPVPSPKPPKSDAKYENVYRNDPSETAQNVKTNGGDIEVFEAQEDTPLQSASSPETLRSSAIYENGYDLQQAALLDNATPIESTSHVAPSQPIPSEYTYEDVLNYADSFLHELEQLA